MKIYSKATCSEIETDELLPLAIDGEVIMIGIDGPLRVMDEDGKIKFIGSFGQKDKLFVSGKLEILSVKSGLKDK